MSQKYLEVLLLPPGVPFLLLSVFLFCRLVRRFSSISAQSDMSTSLLGNIFQCTVMHWCWLMLSDITEKQLQTKFSEQTPLLARIPLGSDDKVPGVLNQIVGVVVGIGRTMRPFHQVDPVVWLK